ncbi:MAG: hypothetical protein HQM09_06060 [Candidatus Riflebacteria bacterium]|nr:hypothetical protein [Candidatus Riflebacteria bacterium]
MKSVACPLCNQTLFSERFWPGEHFPCPHCEHDLTVEEYKDEPRVKSTHDILDTTAWAETIWRDGRLFLTPAKLAILGEAMVSSFNMEVWSKETNEQLEERGRKYEKAHQMLQDADIQDSFFVLGRTLLDLFRRLKERSPGPGAGR